MEQRVRGKHRESEEGGREESRRGRGREREREREGGGGIQVQLLTDCGENAFTAAMWLNEERRRADGRTSKGE